MFKGQLNMQIGLKINQGFHNLPQVLKVFLKANFNLKVKKSKTEGQKSLENRNWNAE